MKKMFRKTMSLFLALVMAFAFLPSMTVFGEIGNQPDEDFLAFHNILVEEFGLEFATNYHIAIETINAINDSFPRNRLGDVMYPEYFGGMYIDDNGVLNVLVTKTAMSPLHLRQFDAVSVLSELNSLSALSLSHMQATNVKEVEFAYSYLWAVMDFLDYFIPNNRDNLAANNVCGVSLSVVSNRIIVHLTEYTQEQIALFRDLVLDSPIIDFAQSEGRLVSYEPFDMQISELYGANGNTMNPLFTITVNPGDGIFVRSPAGVLRRTGSVGYRARVHTPRGWEYGFVTAGHIGFSGPLYSGQRLYNSIGQNIGRVVFVGLQNADAAFVATAHNVVVNNVANLSANVMNPTFGSVVISIGAASGRRTGLVRDPWSGLIGSGEGVHVFAVRATFTAALNDSGGIVHQWVTATNNGVVGIVVAIWGHAPWADGGNTLFTAVNRHKIVIGNSLSLH